MSSPHNRRCNEQDLHVMVALKVLRRMVRGTDLSCLAFKKLPCRGTCFEIKIHNYQERRLS